MRRKTKSARARQWVGAAALTALMLNGCDGVVDGDGSGVGPPPRAPEAAACGNGVCNAGETCGSCAADCGACGPSMVTEEGGSKPEPDAGANPGPDAGIDNTPDAGSTPDAGTEPADECVAPAGLALQDQDFSDSQLPWKRTGKTKVVIYFETKNVTAEFASYMQKGLENWNKSPCLDTRLINTCQAGTNCVTVTAPNPASEDDGNFDALESGGFTTGGHIDVASGLTPGERLNVMVHEMGHAVGLRHRLAERVLMNGDTYEDVFVSDALDYQNLLVLYGNQK